MIEHLKSTLKSVLTLSARPEPVLVDRESLTEAIDVAPFRHERDPLTPALLRELVRVAPITETEQRAQWGDR